MQVAKYSGECLTSGHLVEDLMPRTPTAAFSLLTLSLKGQPGLACMAYFRCFGSTRGHGKEYGKVQEQLDMYIALKNCADVPG